MKTRRLLSAFLALLMVVSSLSFAVSAEDTVDGLFLNSNPNYIRLTDSKQSLYTGTYDCVTEGGATGFTLWFNVKNLYKPVYLYGTHFRFTTTDGHSFGADTGGSNLRNNGFKIDADGDYFLYIPASATSTLHWSCKAEYGLFASIANISVRACDAAAWDANKTRVNGSFDIALMGIIEGKVDLSAKSVQWNDADGTSLGEGAATAERVSNIAISDAGDTAYTNGNWVFSKITAPVTTNAPAGQHILGWADANGNKSLPILSDTLKAVYGDYEYPEDAIVDYTKFADPISTTFGTQANMLAEPYYLTNTNTKSVGVIFKVEGLKEGETANILGVAPVMKHPVEVEKQQQKVDEEGALVFDETGAPVMETVTVTEVKTLAPGGDYCWVASSANGYTVKENGYYMYGMSLQGALYDTPNGKATWYETPPVIGETCLESLTFFANYSNYNHKDCPAYPMTVSEDITLTVVGICENDAPAGQAFVCDADGSILGMGKTNAVFDTTWTGTWKGRWNKITSVSDIYVGNGKAPEGYGIGKYVDAQGNEYAIDDPILGTVKLTAVYGERDVVKYTVSASDIKAGEGVTVTVKVDDPAIASQGKIQLIYDAAVFTCAAPVVDYTTIAEDGTVATFTLKSDLLAAAGDYTFDVKVDATSAKGEVIDSSVAATIAVASAQQPGQFFTGDVVAFNKTTVAEDGSVKLPSQQTLWSGSVNTTVDGVAADGITFIYKLDGVDTPIVANNFNIEYNGSGSAMNSWNWQATGNTGGMCSANLTFEESGYFYMYINKIPNGENAYKTFNKITIFGSGTGNAMLPGQRTNTNENATFQMLGVVANNLTPSVKFMNADGTEIATYSHAYTNFSGSMWSSKARTIGKLISIDDAFAKTGAATPAIPNNEDGTPNLFTGWVDENGNPVGADALYYTRAVYAAYSSDYVEYDATVTVDGDEATLIITGNGTKLDDVISGTVEVTFNDNVFANSNAVNGVITIPYNFTPAEETPEETPEVEPAVLDTDVLATIVLDIDKLAVSGDYDIVINGTAKDAEGNDIYVDESKVVITVDGQNIEGILMDTDEAPWVDLPTNDEGLKATTLWEGYADFEGAGGVTIVYRATGIETPIEAGWGRLYYYAQDDTTFRDMGGEYAYTNGWSSTADNDQALRTYIAADGYYFVYLSRKVLGMTYNNNGLIGAMTKYTVFSKGATATKGHTPSNTNTDAKVQVLAVLADNMQPTVNFYNGNELVGSYQHKYTDTTNATAVMGDNPRTNHFAKGSLLTAADVFAASALATPTKASDENYIYQFKGWVDAEGNPVDAVYYDMDVYADYDKFEKSNKLPVEFYNGTELVGSTEVYENDVAIAPETIPVRDEDATGKFVFKGWATTEGGEVVDLGAYPITEATSFYAVFEHVDVTFKVTYTDFNGKVLYTETVVRSTDAAYATIPTRATDAYNEELQGGYKYAFSFWGVESVNEETGEVTMVPAVLTNVQGDITVIAQYDATLVEEWFTVTWVDTDGSVLSTKKVATGEATSTSVKGNLNGKADENYWYTFSGWDKETTAVTSDMTVTVGYSTTPVATGEMPYTTDIVSGKVGEEHILWNEDVTLDKTYRGATVILNIKGASADNPIRIGDIYAEANGNISNNCYFMIANCEKAGLINKITEDGWYFVYLGSNVLTSAWNGEHVLGRMTYFALDCAKDTRGASSEDASGAATYDAYMFMGTYEPNVRFYDEDGKWLYTGKYTHKVSHDNVVRGKLATAADIYAGEAIENFECWVDADGNEVTYVTNNMSVYAKVKHVHEYVTIGQGQIECTCGDVIDTASTIIAQPVLNADVKAGDKFTVNIVADNLTFVGATLDVTVEGATIAGIDTVGSVFDGYTAEYADGRIVLSAAVGGEDIVADESETIIILVLEADKDMTAEDIVTVKVDIEQIVNMADEDITATVYGGYESELSFEVNEAKPLWGDVNGDGSITPEDSMLLTRRTSGWNDKYYKDLAPMMEQHGDVNGDGSITPEDSMLLTRYTSGWNVKYYKDLAPNLMESLKTLGIL